MFTCDLADIGSSILSFVNMIFWRSSNRITQVITNKNKRHRSAMSCWIKHFRTRSCHNFIKTIPRTVDYKGSHTSVAETTQLLSFFPCKLAYIKPCKCWQLQKYVDLKPNGSDDGDIKGSLDPLLGKYNGLQDQDLDFGDLPVSLDGLIRPENACNPSLMN